MRARRSSFRDARGAAVDGIHTVVQVVHLPAAGQLPPDGVGDDAPVVLQHIGLHRLAVLRRLLDRGHIADARQRHVQRPGIGVADSVRMSHRRRVP